jgi:hypothetical protein
MSASFETSLPPEQPSEEPLLEVELAPSTLEEIAKPYLEKAATVATLAWINVDFANDDDVNYALTTVLALLRPPENIPRSAEDLTDQEVGDYYLHFEIFGRTRNPQTRKLEHVPGEEIKETQRIWRILSRTTATLEQIQAHQLIDSAEAEFASKVLRDITIGLDKGYVTLPRREVN